MIFKKQTLNTLRKQKHFCLYFSSVTEADAFAGRCVITRHEGQPVLIPAHHIRIKLDASKHQWCLVKSKHKTSSVRIRKWLTLQTECETWPKLMLMPSRCTLKPFASFWCQKVVRLEAMPKGVTKHWFLTSRAWEQTVKVVDWNAQLRTDRSGP